MVCSCDKCPDSANKEQLSLSIWYVANERIHKSFEGFFELNEGVIGEAIADTIEQAIVACNLDISLLRGRVLAICWESIKAVLRY